MLPARVAEEIFIPHFPAPTAPTAVPAPLPIPRQVEAWEFPIFAMMIGVAIFFVVDAHFTLDGIAPNTTWVSPIEGYELAKRERMLNAVETEIAQYDRLLPNDPRIDELRETMRAMRAHADVSDKVRLAVALDEIRGAVSDTGEY